MNKSYGLEGLFEKYLGEKMAVVDGGWSGKGRKWLQGVLVSSWVALLVVLHHLRYYRKNDEFILSENKRLIHQVFAFCFVDNPRIIFFFQYFDTIAVGYLGLFCSF